MSNTKYSSRREIMLNVLQNTTCHPNADWIYTEMRREIPNISLGTVYRNLSKLADEGVILRLEVGDGSEHYDGNVSPHAHFYCRSCKKITDIFVDYGKRLKNEVLELSGCKAYGCTVLFNGICGECLER